MKGSDHKGFAVAGAMTLNSVLYVATPSSALKTSLSLLHLVGAPWTWSYLVHLWHTAPTLDTLENLAYKLTFYIILVACASVPDRLERRRKDAMGIPVKHRGFTHSCLIVALLLVVCDLFALSIGQALVSHHVHLGPFSTREIDIGVYALLLAIVLHIVADALTKQGVKMLWPHKASLGVLPRDMRFTNESMGPSIVLWGMYFVAGSLFLSGNIGF